MVCVTALTRICLEQGTRALPHLAKSVVFYRAMCFSKMELPKLTILFYFTTF